MTHTTRATNSTMQKKMPRPGTPHCKESTDSHHSNSTSPLHPPSLLLTHPEHGTEDESNHEHNQDDTDDLDGHSDGVAWVVDLLGLLDGVEQEEGAAHTKQCAQEKQHSKQSSARCSSDEGQRTTLQEHTIVKTS